MEDREAAYGAKGDGDIMANLSKLVQGQHTVARWRGARYIADENSDKVMCWMPIPPGATIKSIHVNNLIVGDSNMEMHQATEIGVHGYFVGVPQPKTGYGESMAAADNMWDDFVPKDRPVDDELDDYTGDSFAGESMMANVGNSGPVEGGAYEDETIGAGTLNIGTIVGAWQGPENFLSRVRRLDVSNGVINETNKFRPIDRLQTVVNKNYHLDDQRYWHLMIGVGAPKFETVDQMTWFPNNDLEWQGLAYPEISVLQGLLHSSESMAGDNAFRSHLESNYIEADTYEDIGNVSGLTKFVCYNNVTVVYKRPAFTGINANSRANS